MTNSKKVSDVDDNNYVVEDFDGYAIVKRKKSGVPNTLKVIQFDESILVRLEQLEEAEPSRNEKLKGLLARWRDSFS